MERDRVAPCAVPVLIRWPLFVSGRRPSRILATPRFEPCVTPAMEYFLFSLDFPMLLIGFPSTYLRKAFRKALGWPVSLSDWVLLSKRIGSLDHGLAGGATKLHVEVDRDQIKVSKLADSPSTDWAAWAPSPAGRPPL